MAGANMCYLLTTVSVVDTAIDLLYQIQVNKVTKYFPHGITRSSDGCEIGSVLDILLF